MALLWGLAAGLIIGILIERWNMRHVIRDKDKEVERFKGNFSLLGEWLAMVERGDTLEKNLQELNIKTAAVYGMGIIGNHVLKQLNGSNVSVKYIVDKNEIKGIYDAIICNPEEKLEGVDAIIITPIYQFEAIRNILQKNNNIKMISVRELINMGAEKFSD